MSTNASYCYTTFNKIQWIRSSLGDLASHRRHGEDIVVADGGSTDGSFSVFETWRDKKKIDILIPGPDCGEAHGWNRALMASTGDIIKPITDDDVYDYQSVQKCIDFMKENEAIDVIVTPFVNARIDDETSRIVSHNAICLPPPNYRETFVRERRAMSTCGLGLVIRRSALAIIGLFDPRYVRMDYEFLRRCTTSKVTIAWYSKPVVLRIHNEQSLSVTQNQRMEFERELINSEYRFVNARQGIHDRLRSIKQIVFDRRVKVVAGSTGGGTPPPATTQLDVPLLFEQGHDILRTYTPSEGEFFVSGADARLPLIFPGNLPLLQHVAARSRLGRAVWGV